MKADDVEDSFDSICPRYLNCLTCSIGSPFNVMRELDVMTSSGTLNDMVFVLSVAMVSPKQKMYHHIF